MFDVHICEIVNTAWLTETVFALSVRSPELVEKSKPGQFLHIKCGNEQLLRRPISICSIYNDEIWIVVEVRGEGTKWLSKQSPGYTLDILGPLGNGFSIPDGKIIVVGGGVGAPPMLLTAAMATGGAMAILGFRDKSKVILRSEFLSVCDHVYITTDDGSYGIHGKVTDPLEVLLEEEKYAAVLSCGPKIMQKAVFDVCKRYNVPCQVSLEEHMGCGVGACLVCACETKINGIDEMSRVCVDGPVFDANTIIW
jgi:dihydroorotate dehydrogenase electron transfer subunit